MNNPGLEVASVRASTYTFTRQDYLLYVAPLCFV